MHHPPPNRLGPTVSGGHPSLNMAPQQPPSRALPWSALGFLLGALVNIVVVAIGWGSLHTRVEHLEREDARLERRMAENRRELIEAAKGATDKLGEVQKEMALLRGVPTGLAPKGE